MPGLYKHKTGSYYVRTYAGGKQKWVTLQTTLLSVAKNRMKEHVEGAIRQRSGGSQIESSGRFRFSQGIALYRRELELAPIQPNTKAYREAGLKLVLKSWEGIESLAVRKITSKMVEEWIGKFKANAKPYKPTGVKSASKVSTGASATTIKCALDAVRQVLDVAVSSGHLAANPARNATVAQYLPKLLKVARREKAEKGQLILPSREEFVELVKSIGAARVADCVAAAEFVEFIAFSGSRKNEAVHVCWKDVDFRGEKILLRVTKNGESRWVPMIAEMKKLLKSMEAHRPDGNTGEDKVLRIKNADGFLTSACRKVGVPRITTHSLRHLFGTTCLEAGVDVRIVAGWMGHKDNGALLLKIYSHVRGRHESAMIKKVCFGAV